MDDKEKEFLKRIQATFRSEADEHLKSFLACLLELEKEPKEESLAGIIETMFREVHSLKGAARSVGQKEVEAVCHPLESLFALLKRQEMTLVPAMLDLFFKTAEFLTKLIVINGIDELPGARQDLKELIQQLHQIAPGVKSVKDKETPIQQKAILTIVPPAAITGESEPLIPKESEAEPEVNENIKKVTTELVKIPISKLNPLLFQAEEFIQSKLSFSQNLKECKEILSRVNDWRTELQKWRRRKVKPSVSHWNEWQEGIELHFNDLERRLSSVTGSMEKDQYSFERIVDDHLDAMKQILMLPVSSVVEAFPAMVREISRDLRKEIDFVIHGSDLEIDKRILDELKDPLIHLIRNSIDHGIGLPEERLKLNKPQKGKITLAFTAKESGLVEITVSDDGKGIDINHVLNAAIKSGALSNEEAAKLSKDEILSLIYLSGLSTRSIITDLSGRGLGLSIVHEKIEKLNGRLSMHTKVKHGTTFSILIPMTLTTFRGIMVSLGESMFILPTINIERVLRVKPDEITSVENHETIRVGEDILSIVNLRNVLGVPERRIVVSSFRLSESEVAEYTQIVVLMFAEKRLAFRVDNVLGEHQVLVKGLGKLLYRVKNISGATIIGSGKIVPVLNIADLMKSAMGASFMKKEVSDDERVVTKPGKILVAEDSITSRTLLKNILETAGYEVVTAVDGADAFTRFKSEAFDLIVSDVDMPRMNGFELTAKVKSDAKLSEIPIVLVTALETREDRERGIEVGADAYIIKSSFDQGNLLEVIKKLI